MFGIADVAILGPGYTPDPGDPETGKPYLRVTFRDGQTTVVVEMTTNLGELLGELGEGARLRWEDQHPRKL